MKSAEEIMEILNAYGLTGSLRDAGELAGCSHHTVKHYLALRAYGSRPDQAVARPQLIDEYLPMVEEWVERSQGKVRSDVAHDKLLALDYTGSERSTRRAVAKAKASYRAGKRRVHRPWVTEPGMWLQYDKEVARIVSSIRERRSGGCVARSGGCVARRRKTPWTGLRPTTTPRSAARSPRAGPPYPRDL